MIIDVTGIELNPGNNGEDCLGNGKHFYKNGGSIECCCDECDYIQCCFSMKGFSNCNICYDTLCPRYKDKKSDTFK